MIVCIPCRDANPTYRETDEGLIHTACGEVLSRAPHRLWSPPKKTNKRAWKRIEKGEWLWDRRRARGKRGPDTYIGHYEYQEVPVDPTPCCTSRCCNFPRPKFRRVRIAGTGKELVNPNRKPDVDLGG